MKLRHTFFSLTAATALLLAAGCTSNRYKAEDLSVPVVQAIQGDNFGKLKSMLPSENVVNDIFSGNTAALGGNFYNKYTRSYRRQNLATALENDLEMIRDISRKNDLDWQNVGMGAPTKEDVTDSAANYTRVTIPLKFEKGGEYTLSYKTIQYQGIWYLLDDIYLQRVRKE